MIDKSYLLHIVIDKDKGHVARDHEDSVIFWKSHIKQKTTNISIG